MRGLYGTTLSTLSVQFLSTAFPCTAFHSHSPSAPHRCRSPHSLHVAAVSLAVHATPYMARHWVFETLSLVVVYGLCCRCSQALPSQSSMQAQIGANSGSGGQVKQLPRSWQRSGHRETSMRVVMRLCTSASQCRPATQQVWTRKRSGPRRASGESLELLDITDKRRHQRARQPTFRPWHRSTWVEADGTAGGTMRLGCRRPTPSWPCSGIPPSSWAAL